MQGKLVNIPSYIEDPSYRYKMPVLQLKIEGKGNGIKTNLLNLYDVAKALRVSAEVILKYMGFELASMTIYKEKGNEVTAIINGNFKEEIINKNLDKFIEKYVLCQKCKYPEMIMRVKNNIIFGQCWSCGAKSELDNKHRITAFILKNPPKNKSEFTKRADSEKQGGEDGTTVNEGNSKMKSKLANQHNKDLDDVEEEDLQIAKQNSEQQQNLSKQPSDQFDLSSLQAPIAQVQELYDSFKEQSDEQQSEEIVKLVDQFEQYQNQKDLLSFIIFNAIFDQNIVKQVAKNSYILQATAQYYENEEDEQQAYFLVNLEYLIFNRHQDKNLEKYIPTILKLAFDEDLLSEDFLLSWCEGEKNQLLSTSAAYNEQYNKQFIELSQDFMKWLRKNAENKDGEEEEDDQ